MPFCFHAHAMMLGLPVTTVLGLDPKRTHRINANSFQGNAITTVNGWQYVAFYTASERGDSQACYVNLARRSVVPSASLEVPGEWQTIIFPDYEQLVDDGHNTISIGVCKGDDTVHVAFDHHCDQLRFRISRPSLLDQSGSDLWDTSLFTKTQDFLPGILSDPPLKEVTYPRFANIGEDMLLTMRIGQAGLGSDILYRYSSTTHTYTYLGQQLTGISNSPYINGIDFRLGRVHLSWCYRNFIEIPASASNAHKQQAGPNGPENNYDLNYAYSQDFGETWKSSEGITLAKIGSKAEVGTETTIKPGNAARVFEIPMRSGILNQEAQAADWEGGFWVLNREIVRMPTTGSEEAWVVYHRDSVGNWTKNIIECISRPTETGSRGSVCVDRKNNVYLILPGNSDSTLTLMQKAREKERFETVWRSSGFDGEPLVDVQRLEGSDAMSIFTRTDKDLAGERKVVVLDFALEIGG